MALAEYAMAIRDIREVTAINKDPNLQAWARSYEKRVAVLKKAQLGHGQTTQFTPTARHRRSSSAGGRPPVAPRQRRPRRTTGAVQPAISRPRPRRATAPVHLVLGRQRSASYPPHDSAKAHGAWLANETMGDINKHGCWVKEGWLDKRKSKHVLGIRAWHQRFFRLALVPARPQSKKLTLSAVESGAVDIVEAKLLYFIGAGGLPRGSRDIYGMQVSRSKQYGSLALEIVDGFGAQETLHVRAASPKDQEGWLAALRTVIDVINTTRGATATSSMPDMASMANMASMSMNGITSMPDMASMASAASMANPIGSAGAATKAASSASADPSPPKMDTSAAWQELITTAEILGVTLNPPPHLPLPLATRTFRTSNFKLLYCQRQPPTTAAALSLASQGLVKSFARVNNIHAVDSQPFCVFLEKQLLQYQASKWNVGNACEYLWTSTKKMAGTEFCSILNAAIRRDEPLDMVRAIMVVKGINVRRVLLREQMASSKKIKFPKNGLCFRGGGFRNQHQAFFCKGRKYRVPGFLATSLSLHIAKGFARRADAQHPRIVWTVVMDPRGETDPVYRCNHVNFVQHTVVKGESEYLFAPYSVFAVTCARWSNDLVAPHEIEVKAALDNRRESEDLPLAPWF